MMLGAMKNFVKATKLIGRIPKIEQKLDLLLWETPDIPRDFFPKFVESARQMGWLESAKQHKPMTADGEPCPWYTYPMLHFLKRHQDTTFDVVVIDGRDRVNCAKATMNLKQRPSAIIWDNSERERYQEGYDLLINNGYRRLDFDGFGPVNGRPWRTSVFYMPDNCLKI